MRIATLGLCLLFSPVLLQAQDLALSGVLIDGAGWEVVGEGYEFTEGPAVDPQGRLYFTDVRASKIYRTTETGVELFVENSEKTNGLMFGPDGKLYGCQNGARKIVSFDETGKATTIAEGVDSNDLVVAGNGDIYFTDPAGGKVWLIRRDTAPRVVAEGLKPNGVILWADGGTLVVTDAEVPALWTFRIDKDGSLSGKDQYYGPLRMVPGENRTGSDGMTIDTLGRLYVATRAGLQVFDPIGRMSGVIGKPQNKGLSNVVFGGPDLMTMYVTCTDKVYRRKTQAVGVRYLAAP